MMTLDEAIWHAEEIAEKFWSEGVNEEHCRNCGFEHAQLAEWLKELKVRRGETASEVEALAEAYDGFPAQVQVKGCKDCTINIYPSQTKFVSINGDEERQKGYEDGYDDGCMDMIDDEEEEHHG